jgi:hypothetical protein
MKNDENSVNRDAFLERSRPSLLWQPIAKQMKQEIGLSQSASSD